MLVRLPAETERRIANAIESHDGVARKRARILREAASATDVKQVARVTGYSAASVRKTLAEYERLGDDYVYVRPASKPPMIENALFATYEGPAWEYYGGALSHGPIEVNQYVLEQVQRHFPDPANTRILEVGPGEGTLSMMLRDAGYGIECVDIGDFDFVPTDIPITFMDAQEGLSAALAGEKYDAVIAVEVIEHLKHPWRFVEEVFELLRPDGVFFMSTPNISGFLSRARFLLLGQFFLFPRPTDAGVHNHIMPLQWEMIEHMLRQVGYDRVRTTSIVDVLIFSFESLRAFAFSFVRLLAWMLAVRGPRKRHLYVEASRPKA